MPRKIILVAAVVFVAGCQSEPPVGLDQPTLEPRVTSPTLAAEAELADHFVIQYDGSVADMTAAVEAVGGTVYRAHDEIGVAMIRDLDDATAADLEAAEVIERVTRDLIVPWTPGPDDFAQDDGVSTANHIVGDPTTAAFYPCQWNLHQINAAGAWAQGEFGNTGVKVAVLDTGVDPTHNDLVSQIDVPQSVSMLSSPSICDLFVPDQVTIFDFRFHGTFVSGIITASGFGIAGVAPDSRVVGVKVLNCLGSGSFADVIAGIIYAANLSDVDVINMSLGARFPKNATGAGPLVAAMNKAVNYAQGVQGKLVVSSAGNNGADLDKDKNFVNVPAQSGSGIAAWAGDIDGNLASYSNHGRSGAYVGAGGGDNTPGSPNVPLPGCVLPASGHDGIVSVCSTFSLFFGCGPNSYLFNGSGTSFSAPAVSGVAALVDGMAGGGLNGNQLKTILKQTADDLGKKGSDNLFSHGRVNANNAVQ